LELERNDCGFLILLSLIHSSLAWEAMIFSFIFIHLPDCASGIVSTHTTSNLGSSTSCFKKAFHIGAQDAKTTRYTDGS
jgi:hypothetical protein